MSEHRMEYTGESRRRSCQGNKRKRRRKRRRVGFLRRAAAVLVVIAVLFALKNVIRRTDLIYAPQINNESQVYLKPEEVSLAIGKGGLNIKLASMLTEYTIDVYRELGEDAVADEDIYLDEFKDEIDEWVINAIKAIGIDTAKGVLNAPREMLIEKADLEENTVDDILRILKAEFEE